MGLVNWMYLHPRADLHSGTGTQYRSLQTPWLAVESSLMRVSSYFGFVSRLYLHLRSDVHSGTRTQYRSLQTPWLVVESRTRVSSYLGRVSWMYLNLRVDISYYEIDNLGKQFGMKRSYRLISIVD
ncbi:unnamed protein product [Schistosoma mattheei]|uniref:Uncharacterized protein n=1 Tax=Schistosoma mattheei TaxID=31246 RepID=A0A3P8DS64_9TREM|nr:unnamed protein product [Schistosoma mattheei]